METEPGAYLVWMGGLRMYVLVHPNCPPNTIYMLSTEAMEKAVKSAYGYADRLLRGECG